MSEGLITPPRHSTSSELSLVNLHLSETDMTFNIRYTLLQYFTITRHDSYIQPSLDTLSVSYIFYVIRT